MKKVIFFSLILFCITFMPSLLVSAQTGTTPTISPNAVAGTVDIFPKVIDETANARDIIHHTVVFENKSDRLYALVYEITANNEVEFTDPEKFDRSTTLSSWLRIQRSAITVIPHSSTTVPLTIEVDITAKPGNYHSAVVFGSGNNPLEAKADLAAPKLLVSVAVQPKTPNGQTTSTSSQTTDIKISPVKFEDIVYPGNVLSETIKLINESSIRKTLYADLRDFNPGSSSGVPQLIMPGSKSGPYLSSWIDITQKILDFGPREQKTVNFQIKVPSNIGPGGYYGAIVFGTQPPKLYQSNANKYATTTIAQQTGALILLQVKGKPIEKANIREFSTDKNFYSSPITVNFTTRIENTGNVHIIPQGVIKIKNKLGENVATLSFNNKGASILPKSIRRFDNSWKGKLGPGRYRVDLVLKFGTAVKNGGKGIHTLTARVTFSVTPRQAVSQSKLKWYAVKITTGKTYYGQIGDVSADPVVVSNVYYNYDQLNNKGSNATPQSTSEIGTLRLVKLEQETAGGNDTMDIVRSQVLYLEPLADNSPVLKAILDYENK